MITNNDFKLLLRLRHVNYKSWEQIAEIMGYSTSYMYKQHHLAVKEFNKLLKGKKGDWKWIKI